jgi:hypothetical protein
MSLRVLPCYVAIALIFGTASASAQPTAYPPGLQPVSPGHFTSATPAAACPGFSWAAKPGAIGYELAVHKVTRQTQLDPVPVLNAMLPGTAAAWTPSIDQCLETGSEYMWFIREVGEVGEPIGGWSEGMRFRVAAAGGTASNRREATNDAADQPPGGGRPGGPPPTNQEILNRLNEVLTLLQEPEPTFSFVLCTEPALQGEVELGSQVTLDGTIEGRVGAEGYGNGAMVRLKGAPAAKLDGKIKGGWDMIKLGVCWDIGATVRNRRAQPIAPISPFASASAAGGGDLADVIAGLDLADIQAKLQALATRLQFDPARSIAALESLGDMSFDGNPFAALGEDGIFRQLAVNLPLPENIRALVENPASLFDSFVELRDQGLCNIDLPPALTGPIGQVCQLIASEPFGALLNRVDGAVTSVRNVVNRIENALPTNDDCKFFCGQ